MASTKLRKYNAIPRGDDKKAIDALTRIAETLTGATGDKLEKALTLRDLEALDLVTIQKGLNKQGGQFTNIIKVGDTVTEADLPAKPVNFGAVGTYSNILLSWDTPTYKGHSTTEIYRSDTDVLGASVFIGSTISSLYGDPVGTNSSYYYWIRHVNINGDKGPYNDTSGVFAETAPDIDYLLEQLANQINTSHLAVELRNDIDWISKPDGIRDALFKVDGVVDTLNMPDTGLVDQAFAARSDLQALGVDTSYIRDGIQATNKELLNIGSAVHNFRKSYEERAANGERLIDASVYIDPDTGLIINRAFSYTDESYTNAQLLIDGVDGKIELAVSRVVDLEDKSTLADATFEVLAGQINSRATYTEVENAVSSGIAALVPKYSFQFNSDTEGFTGVSHNASGWISSTAASPATSPAISYLIEDYPTFRMLVRLQTGGIWNGLITAGGETIPVPAPSVENSWEVITVKAISAGTITSVTFDLGDADIDYIEIAKQGSNDLALDGLTARVTVAEANLSAIDGTYITGIVTTWYNGGEIITSDVNTLINSFDSTYSVSATITDINANGTVSKANSAQTWVNAADANIRDVVLSYNSEEGITNVSVDLDGLNGRITNQVFAIGGLEQDIYSAKQAALTQEYYMHLLRAGGEIGDAKLALANTQLRAYVDNNGDVVAEQLTQLLALGYGNEANIQSLNSAIVSESSTRLASITTLQGSFNDVNGRVDDVTTLNLSADSALIQRFVNVEAGVEGADGRIQDVINLNVLPSSVLAQKFTTIDGAIYKPGTTDLLSQALFNDVVNLNLAADSAIISKFTTIEATVNNADTGVAATSGKLTDLIDLTLDSTSAIITKFTALDGAVFDAQGNSISAGLFDDIITLNLSGTSALVERFTTLESTIYDEFNAPKWVAGITGLQTALSYNNGAIAIDATDVYVIDGAGNQQGIQQYTEVVADNAVENAPVTAIWRVKTTINQVTGGFGLYNDGTKTSFLVSANNFAVINPDNQTARALLATSVGVPNVPDGVYIDTAFINQAFIKTITSEHVNSDYVNALNIDVAGKLTASGVDFNGGTFTIGLNGDVIAKNITIQDSLGNTILSSGGTVNIAYSGLSGLPTLGNLAGLNTVDFATQVTNKNNIFRQTTTPLSGVKSGDLWFDTDDNFLYRRGTSSWDLIGPSSLGDLDNVASSKLNNIQEGATQNIIIRQDATPSVGLFSTGDIWTTVGSPQRLYIHDGSAWQLQSNNTTNTNQLTDGASLGATAFWASITGTGKPADNADVTASAFTQSILEANAGLSANNYSTFIDAAYIKNLLVDQLIAANIYANNIEGDVVDSSVANITTPITINASTSKEVFRVDIKHVAEFARIFILSGVRVRHDNGTGPTSTFTAQLFVDGVHANSYTFVDTTESRNESITLAAYLPENAIVGSHTVSFKIVTGSDDKVVVPQQSIFFNTFKEGSTYSNLVVNEGAVVGESPPGNECVCEDMYLVDGLLAKDAMQGDVIDVTDLGPLFKGAIQGIKHGNIRPCVRMQSASGAIWKGSIETPITRQDGSVFYPLDALNEMVYVSIDNQEYWEPITSVVEIGELPIVRIYVGNISYAAGQEANKRILTHNIFEKP